MSTGDHAHAGCGASPGPTHVIATAPVTAAIPRPPGLYTMPTLTDHSLDTISVTEENRAEAIFDRIQRDPGVCGWCFARIRHYYPDYEHAVAEHLSRRNCAELTFEGRGHEIRDDGTMCVNETATSVRTDAAVGAVVPEKRERRYTRSGITIGWEVTEGPSYRTVCECGTVDEFDRGEKRPTPLLFSAVEHIAGQLATAEVPFNERAADLVVREAMKRRSLAGKDRKVLIGAIEFGLRKAQQ